jgi:hypothetical protein
MDEWGSAGVDVVARGDRAGAGRAQRARIRAVLVRSLRELFPVVEGARVRVRPTFGGAWEIGFSCACPARHADVAPLRDARADTLVESLASVALTRVFGRVTVEHATARPEPCSVAWRIRLTMCV